MAARPGSRRGHRPLIALTAASLTLVGCSSQDPTSASTPTPARTSAESPDAIREDNTTCAELAADPDGLGAKLSADREDNRFAATSGFPYYRIDTRTDSFVAGPDGEPVALLADGTRVDGYAAVFALMCGTSQDSTLDAVRHETLDGTNNPECYEYLILPADTQTTWATLAGIVAGGTAAPTQDQLAGACLAHPDQTILEAANTVVSGAFVAADPAGTSRYLFWESTSNLGFVTETALRMGDLQVTSDANPDGPFNAGPVCGYDPETDALLPLRLTAVNNTPGYSAVPASSFEVGPAPGASPETVWVSVVNHFNDTAAGCEEQGADGFVRAGVQSGIEVRTGDGLESEFFVILHDYKSPRFPDGNTADLGNLILRAKAPYNEEDPATLTAASAIHLDGTPVG